MASQRRTATLDQLATRPTYLTTLGSRYPDGRCRSSMDGTVWLYRTVPLAPVVDARDNDSQLAAMEPLFRAYQELGAMVGASSNRRFVARSSYRRTHALLVNIPRFFHLPWTHPIAGYLNRAHGHEPVDRRLLMFGVQLKDSVSAVAVGGGTGSTPSPRSSPTGRSLSATSTRTSAGSTPPSPGPAWPSPSRTTGNSPTPTGTAATPPPPPP